MSLPQVKINRSAFREYDVRGIAGKDLSPEFAELLGLAYATFISGRPPVAGRKNLTVSVGRDVRLTGEAYSQGLIRGLRRGGLDVIDIGMVATPLSYFSTFHLDLDGAIIVTGSHNPPDYNGFKISVGRSTIHGSQIQELLAIMEKGPKVAEREGSLTEHPLVPEYIDYVITHAKKSRSMKVVLDAGNGAAAHIAPELFRRLGADVVELYCEPDGRFPNHHPDPTVPKNLRDLVEAVRREKADFGVAFDGDADRIGLVDETGRIIYGDELMVLLSRDVLKTHPGATVISEVKSSNRLYEDIRAHGGNAVMWKTGHSLIKSKMKETQAALAGEMSGHIFFADRYFGYDDAIYAATRVYEIAAAAAGPVSSLIADLPPSISTPEIRLDCEEEKKFRLVEETKKRLSQHKVNDIDGVRVDFSDGWGLVRASNTQPVLVLRFEAQSEQRLEEIRAMVESALKDAASAIGHAPIDTSGSSH